MEIIEEYRNITHSTRVAMYTYIYLVKVSEKVFNVIKTHRADDCVYGDHVVRDIKGKAFYTYQEAYDAYINLVNEECN